MSHWVFILCTSFLLWARSCLGMGLSSFSSAPISLYFWFVGRLVFLQCHFVASAMLPLDLCLLSLFWACHDFFLIQFTLPSISAGLILIPFWASSALFIFFGHPRPALFLWASLAHSILTFSWAFITSCGLPWPNYHIIYFRDLLAFVPIPFTNSFLWAPSTHFACFPL